MNFHRIRFLSLLLLVLLILPASPARAQTSPVVHAVLFYSPSCGHCHYVINEILPPLFAKHGEQLQIIGVDVSQVEGQTLFMAALQKFGQESNGVPFLVVGDKFLVGSVDIPEKFPGLIEQYLALGGIDWPDIPGLQESLAQAAQTTTEAAAEPTPVLSSQPTADTAAVPPESGPTQPAAPEPASPSEAPVDPAAAPGLILPNDQDLTWRDKFLRDTAGNTLSVIVLFGMLAALVWTGILFRSRTNPFSKGNWNFVIPALCLVGFFVAGYLAYVETNQVTAVCGPVGDCNTVQQSAYARLFGVLPIGVLGLAGYTLIVLAWVFSRYANHPLAGLAAIAIFAMTVAGTLFSVYLTFLEPFVIGATCAWCLTSAVLMTALMLLSIGPAKAAIQQKARSNSALRTRNRRNIV